MPYDVELLNNSILFAISVVHGAMCELKFVEKGRGFEASSKCSTMQGDAKRGSRSISLELRYDSISVFALSTVHCVDAVWQYGATEFQLSKSPAGAQKSRWKFIGRVNTHNELELYEAD